MTVNANVSYVLKKGDVAWFSKKQNVPRYILNSLTIKNLTRSYLYTIIVPYL